MKYNPQALRAHRLKAGLEIPELAQRAGLERTTVRYLDLGVTEPRAKTLAALCRVLQVTPNDFFELDQKAS